VKLPRLIGFLALVICVEGFAQEVRHEVIGYFPSWKWRQRNNLVTPERIPYSKLTMINYAFFYPLPDGSIAGRDTVGDRLYLYGDRETALVPLAHRHGVKVLLSLGGWEDSGNFPLVASTPLLRTAFAHACLGAIRTCDFDGIDIDWEFPGYRDHQGTSADRENFTQLLSVLRDSLDAYAKSTGRRYLLTAALPSGGEHVQNIDVRKIAAILDQLNIMTYDYYGPWDPVANHNAPLYPSSGADTTRSVDASFRLYRQSLGVPASRINIGIPFYGHAYARCAALNAPHAGEDTLHFPPPGAFYYDILAQERSFTKYRDERARTPYMVSTAWNVLVSFDDEESVRAKAEYVVAQGAHGVIIWEITGDYLADGRTPLLDALTSALRVPSLNIR
jgi:chitinase